MDTTNLARRTLLVVQAIIALTAMAGGTALILGAVNPDLASVLSPPVAYLDGSPFSSYLIPGILLGVLLGGVHVVAFVALLRRERWAFFASAAAAFATLIWIFVQMVFIPFSFLQAFYFIAGIAEAGLVMILLGLFTHHTRAA